jgi:uncharacterized membrane protein YdbT with pleckstrin-like domain
MSYHSKVLLPDEQIRAVGRLHWAIFLKGWLLLAIAAVAGVAALELNNNGATEGAASYAAPIAIGVDGIFLVLALFSLMAAATRRSTTEIVVTDRRVLFKEGFLRRRTMEMNMNKVETVDVVQSITGRIFNFGTVVIRGVGSSYEPLDMVANPLALRTAIVAQ